MISLADIEAARSDASRAGAAHADAAGAKAVGSKTGAEVFVKYENLQVTNSFKDRGALREACVARPRTSARAASSPCRPAITPRRSPTMRAGSALPRPS